MESSWVDRVKLVFAKGAVIGCVIGAVVTIADIIVVNATGPALTGAQALAGATPTLTVVRDPEHAVTCWIAGSAMSCLRDDYAEDCPVRECPCP